MQCATKIDRINVKKVADESCRHKNDNILGLSQYIYPQESDWEIMHRIIVTYTKNLGVKP